MLSVRFRPFAIKTPNSTFLSEQIRHGDNRHSFWVEAHQGDYITPRFLASTYSVVGNQVSWPEIEARALASVGKSNVDIIFVCPPREALGGLMGLCHLGL